MKVYGLDFGPYVPGIFSLRNMEDVDRIYEWVVKRRAESAVVVGGGYIGLEMVENLCRRGVDVTLLELLDQVMPPMDPEMVAPIYDELQSHGVDLRLSCGAASFTQGRQESLSSRLMPAPPAAPGPQPLSVV